MSKEILELKPQRLWQYFYDLTQIPRPSGHMDAVKKYVADLGKSLGLEVKTDKVGNVLLIKPASAGMENAPTVILQTHLDMVPQKNSNVNHDFVKDAIDAVIDGPNVKAKNTTLGADNGIGVAAVLAVLEDKTLKHGKIEALFTVDEETGMFGAFGLEPGFLKGTVMLNLDTEEEGELCVGCAGGVDVNAIFGYKDAEAPTADVAFKISLTGLRGGHSGCDIHLGRANANKLMFRFLKEAVADCEARLASIDGGSLRNAIPREAFAVVTIPAGGENDFVELVQEYADIFKEEYKSAENKITFVAEKVHKPKTVLPEEIQDCLINAVVAAQNGVISMLTDFEGIVETSTNLAIVKSEAGKTIVQMLARSSSETRKNEISSALESTFALAGAKVAIENSYPGWQPNAKSKTLDVMTGIFLKQFGRDAEVKVVHAGLECGIILGAAPGLDIVSFGPTIVNPHSPDELVEIETVPRFYDFLVKTLENLK